MKRKGDIIFWEISELETTKEALEAAGFGAFVPRNDYKSAVIKTLKLITKGNEKLYRRFNDKHNEVSFGVFVETVTGDSLAISKEIIVRLDKETGILHHVEGGPETVALFGHICEVYNSQKASIDSNQFRQVVLRAVQAAHGVKVRSGGGVYFIDERFDDSRSRLRDLFNAFPTKAKLFSFPIYSDEGSLEVIENAASEDIFGEINALIAEVDKEFRERKITRRKLEGARERATAIVESIAVHRENLRGSLEKVSDELNRVRTAISNVFEKVEEGIVEPGEFMDLLRGLK